MSPRPTGRRPGHIKWKRRETEENVWDLALDRTRRCFEQFDHVWVSFSGGKDSTVVLNAALEIAEERGQLPLRVVFYDEEAIPYETEDYARRVAADPRVAFEWWCLPVQHRNACSRDEPHWWPWAEESRDLWCRDLPPEALTELPGFVVDPPDERPSLPISCGLMAPPDRYGSVGCLMGIRADESLTRRKAVGNSRTENFIIPDRTVATNYFKCQPAGTRVRLLSGEEVPIETLQPGDRVASYHGKQGSFRALGRPVTAIGSRPFDGDLVTVEIDGRRSRYTPDHLCVVRRLGAAFSGHHVYLMRRGDRFRIGRCLAWGRKQPGSGLKYRGKTEGADAAWVLSRHATAEEAAVQEALLQWRWGIPGLTFQAANTSSVLDQRALDAFWDGVGDLTHAAKAVLTEYGREIDYPIWEPGRYLSSHRGAEIRACNLMDGMECVTDVGGQGPIAVGREHYRGDVWSMDVDVDHTYVADGIVTHNCYTIYDMRTSDVWTAPARFGWDHNRAYDLMEMAGITHHAQRCAPPYGEQPMQKLWVFKQCFPDLWEKMVDRVPGAATAALYATTDLYSFGDVPAKPDGVTWEEFIHQRLEREEDAHVRTYVAYRIAKMIQLHYSKTTDPILSVPHPESGVSWPWLYKLADRGDLKERSWPDYNGDPDLYEATRSIEAPETVPA